MEKGTLEPEYWFDYARRDDSDIYFQRHNPALEYGVTDHLMIDGRVTADHPFNHMQPFYRRSRNSPPMASVTPSNRCHDGGSRKNKIPAMAMMAAPPAKIAGTEESGPPF